jgi:orotidine-5'-phosphate decarboxylase
MLERAAERAARESNGRLTVLAVTVLTSLDDGDLRAQGVSEGASAHALTLARMAHAAGVRGFVCSPAEVHALRDAFGAHVTLVTPGVRPAGPRSDDQKRVATAESAIADGADIVVVGRPIRDAADPVAKARSIAEEIQKGLSRRGRS